MEPYSSASCGAAAAAFVTGWDTQLLALGYSSGVYGSPDNAQSDWWFTNNAPYDVWIAKTRALSSPSITIWGLSPLTDDRWATVPGSRIHHYSANNSVSWGGIALAIDHDIEYAMVVSNGPTVTKTYSFTFTTIDYPGAQGTGAHAINNVNSINGSGFMGQVVGSYFFANGPERGYFYNAGSFTAIDYPGATATSPLGMNDLGSIVGVYFDSNTVQHGFVYNSGSYTTIDYPGAFDTRAYAVNDAGWVVGAYDAAGVWHGFVYKNGQFGSPIDAPGANGVTFALGINGIGPIGGSYVGTDGNVHGFLDIAGAFTPIDFPGADVTYPFSVNNNG